MSVRFVLFFLLLASPALAAPFDQGYAAWDAVLRETVDDQGRVDYSALASQPGFEAFIASFAAVTAEEAAGWPRDEQLAFWINAYNALTMKSIVDAGIPASIRDIKPNAWEAERWSVAGHTISLNWIEHTRLRKQLKEPRVHFVLVCAARSCPILPNRAVLPTGLDGTLDALARRFFRDPSRNRVDAATHTVHLSRILDWYGGDFEGLPGTPEVADTAGLSPKEVAVIRAMAKYATDVDRPVLIAGGLTVVYNEYDWSLNRR